MWEALTAERNAVTNNASGLGIGLEEGKEGEMIVPVAPEHDHMDNVRSIADEPSYYSFNVNVSC